MGWLGLARRRREIAGGHVAVERDKGGGQGEVDGQASGARLDQERLLSWPVDRADMCHGTQVM